MKISSEIAEILGAFIGDGWIEARGRAVYITGDRIEDKDYYDKFLGPLFSKNFTKTIPKEFPYWKVYGIYCYKKEIINECIKLGFQIGKKSYVAKIPNYIFESSKEVKKAVLRGIFDTDGCFWCDRSRAKTTVNKWKKTYNYIPQISISSCSKELVKQMKFLLSELEIYSTIRQKTKAGWKHSRNINSSYELRIRRIKDIEKWFDTIGTNNPRHKTRYNVWKKLGHLPPKTTIKQRIAILNN